MATGAVVSKPASAARWLCIDELGGFAQVLTTTRFQGVSLTPYESLNLGLHVGDDPHSVDVNRKKVRQALPDDPVWLRQVHGLRVLDADHIESDETFEADAAVTNVAHRVLAIQTADCMPIVVTAGQEVLGVAHAGWRGLVTGVLPALINAMQQKHSLSARSARTDWQAWIGPCISAPAFQVGKEVYDAFVSARHVDKQFFVEDVGAPHKWRCDLPGLAISQLQRLGIEKAVWCGLCTVTDEQRRFYSYRREGQTGRMATLAWLN